MLRCSYEAVFGHCRGDLPKSVSFTIEPEDGEAVLFGKTVDELQSDIAIDDDQITGTLHYVEGYTDFSSEPSQQSGNYLALKFTAPEDATTTVEVLEGTKGPVTLDEDMNIVLLIADEETQSVKVTVKKGDETTEKVYGLTGLNLEID